MARTSIATDNFNRAGPALGSDWSNMNTSNSDVVIESSVKFRGQYGVQPTQQRGTARWVGSGSFSDDQYAEVTLSGIGVSSGSAAGIGVICRASGSAGTRSYYEFLTTGDGTTSPTPTSLCKWVAGTRTELYAAEVAWTDGDELSLEVEGTTVRACKNGTALGGSWTVTDASISTGVPGIVASGATMYGDDWVGGDITAPASPVFSGTIPAKTGTAGAAFSWVAPTLASYFTGAGITYTVSTALSAIGLSIDGSTGVISGTGTTGTWTGTVTATNVDGSDTSNSFTITISAAPADLSSPTVTSVGATTATCGFSTDTATGNGYFLRRTGLSAASAATIISTGESQAISGTGAQTRAMTAFTSGLTYYVDMAQTGSTEVVTAGPFYPGTGRPVSDVDVTGWTASTGSDLWAMLDEDTASDSDYVTSPALSVSATTGSHALDKTYTAGTYSIKVRAKTDTGAGTLAVRLLNGSNVSQGVTADQAITSTWTTYTLPITITGDATRIRYEVVAA